MTDDDLELAIGARIKELRIARGLTLDELANASAVSRAMISRIERAEASPTASLLSRLCAALGLSLSAFFVEEDEEVSPLARRDQQAIWRDPGTGYVRRAVSPPGTGSKVDVVEVIFPAGARVIFPPNTASLGMTQHVWLFEGEMEVTHRDVAYRLLPGDCLFMGVGDGHAFHNPGEVSARYSVILDRGRS
ncbi:helix-turn-helix domain-containing protein [Rhizobium miluonense]|uniref:Transcriptional regulator, contains XRE-family HTH domain n=1 Tax=Rhizobium miluonense TaxID=411945 RepID=A0A1C3U1R7_9HYPH|nr:helix-turn-helix transcriptional regulator [Rhizobium miluonense]SCB09411.1 Transcriptional regulator, contains XRE-family HTH domain [Rhizobium miluonense]